MSITRIEDARYLDVNESYARLVGHPREALVGRSALEIGIWEEGDRARLVQKLVQEGRLSREECRFRAREGEERIVLVSAELIPVGGERCILGIAEDVTERARAEEALRARERQLSLLIETAPILIAHLDHECRFKFTNRAYVARHNMTPAEIVGRHLSEVHGQAAYETVRPYIDQVLAGRSVTFEAEVDLPGVGLRCMYAQYVPEVDAAGNVFGFVAVVKDITERRRTERDQALLAAIVASSEDAIISKTTQGIITSWNAGAERIFGYTAEEAVGRSILMLIPPGREQEEDHILDCIRSGKRVDHFQTERITKDGRRLDISVTVSPLRDAAGRVVGASKIARDVTASKRAERALRESETRFRSLADTAPMLIWMSGTDRCLSYFNEGWLRFTGRTVEEELGDGWTAGVHPDDSVRYRETYVSAFDRREPFEIEYRLRRHDGQYRWILGRGAPRFAPDGTFVGYIGSCVDVHDRKRAEIRMRLLADTGRIIEQVLDYDAMLEQVARLAVPAFADWCVVDLLQEDGSIRPVTMAHADPEQARAGWALRAACPVDPDAPAGVAHVLRTGQSVHYPSAEDDRHAAGARDAQHLRLLHDLGFSSAVIVGMRSGGRIVGTLTFVQTESHRAFDEADLATAEEIGLRAGVALEAARLHAALLRSEERYRAIVESQTEMVCRFRPDGTILFVNGAYARARGTTPEALAGVNFWEWVDEADRPAVRAMVNSLRPEAPEVLIENRFETSEGVRWTLWANRALTFDAEGRPVDVQSSGIDITDRKEAEAQLAFQKHALDQASIVAITDVQGTIQYVNDTFCEISGYTRAELLGQNHRILNSGRHSTAFFRDMYRTIARGQVWRGEICNRRKDGTLYWVDTTIVPEMRPDGRPERYLAIRTDITERRLAEEELRRSEATLRELNETLERRVAARTVELEQRNEELQQFAFVASHDLQEPLRKVQAFAGLLRDDYGDRLDENGLSYVNRIENAGARMSHLLADLLGYSRVATQGQPFRLVNVRDVAEQVLGDLELAVTRAEAQVEVDADVVLEADADQLRQVLNHLCLNALKFRREGVRPHLRITAAVQEAAPGTAGACRIMVEDNGIGFDDKYAERIFRPFERLHGRSAYEGTGMGLAICRRIAARHRGTIRAESTQGVGSRFVMELPLRQTDAAAGPA